jgi:SAM-dependent methyltransferase
MSPLNRIAKQLIHRATSLVQPQFECPICHYQGVFAGIPATTGFRKHARCPRCSAVERHRLQYVVMQTLMTRMEFAKARMLHVAPEAFFRPLFSQWVAQYETADLYAKQVDHRVDLCALPFADASYDIVYASHVLEHIADDQQAIAEIRRILSPTGIAILPVPIVAEYTVEYPAPNPHESDHVRAPGFDYFERYRAHFSWVELIDSNQVPARYQTFVHEDRSRWPTSECPLRPPMAGKKHRDVVPICYC